jgi:hypothetical protein
MFIVPQPPTKNENVITITLRPLRRGPQPHRRGGVHKDRRLRRLGTRKARFRAACID